LTIATVTDVVGAGDTILLPKQDIFPLSTVVSRVNRALTNLGDVPYPDTSLTTAGSQTEYSLPVAAKRGLRAVYCQGLADTNDNQWAPVSNWRLDPTTAGTAGTLILPQLPSGMTLKLIYVRSHPTVSLYSDYISEYIAPKVVSLAVAVEALEWYNNREENQGNSEYYMWLMQEKKKDLREAKVEFPVWKPNRQPRYFVDTKVATNL